MRSTGTTEEHTAAHATSEANCVHGAGARSALRDEQHMPQVGNNLVPCDEGATGRARLGRKQGNQATTGVDYVPSQPEVGARVDIIDSGREHSDLRDTSLQSSAMGDGVRTASKTRDKHMVWGELIDLLAEPSGARRVDIASPSNREATRSHGRAEEGGTTNNKETTERANGHPRDAK